jgi:hypothetical protein
MPIKVERESACYARQGAPPASSSATKELSAVAIRVTSRIQTTPLLVRS